MCFRWIALALPAKNGREAAYWNLPRGFQASSSHTSQTLGLGFGVFSVVFFFFLLLLLLLLQTEHLWQPAFLTAFAHFVPSFRVLVMRSILDFFVVITFVMVIGDYNLPRAQRIAFSARTLIEVGMLLF